jgi:hypothetical protein
MTALAGSAAYAENQPKYIISLSKVTERQSIKYEISFVARFDKRVVVDTGMLGPLVNDVIAVQQAVETVTHQHGILIH